MMNAETVQTPEDKRLAGPIDVCSPAGVSSDAATPRVLIVEDDLPLAKLLRAWLQTQNFAVETAADGEAAMTALEDGCFDLLLLDLNLPRMDGLALLAYLRASEHARLAVLVLSGRSRIEDTVSTLNQGADDYLIKPFSLQELLARAQALLRRQGRGLPAVQPQSLTINREEFSARRDGTRIDLTPREFAILEYMMQHKGKPVSRATLIQEVWKTPLDPGTNIVDVYMKYLRDKIDHEGKSKLIRTIRGVGYVLNCA
jgi:DNA-binding response OmpR family regulator